MQSLGYALRCDAREAEETEPAGRQPPFAVWPISHSAVAALADLGMSDRQIAEYFSVEPQEVAELRAAGRVARPGRSGL